MVMPQTVHITEVGPRDGLQMESQVLATADKAALIGGLADAGLTAIQVAAFVNPQKVPQMADAEAVIARLPREGAVAYSALTLNVRGVQRACRTPIPWIEVSLSASDLHSRRNTGFSVDQAADEAQAMIELALQAGRKVRGSIQCVFGYAEAGDVSLARVKQIAAMLMAQGASMLVLADTAGLAAPPAIHRVLEALMPLSADLPLGLHLHDTRGLGLVNVMAALQMGISHFDTSLGGLGGCPFIPGASGNIATEDTLYLLHSLNIPTGVDMGRVAALSRNLSRLFGRRLPGKLYPLQ